MSQQNSLSDSRGITVQVLESIARKRAARPEVDHNGTPIPGTGTPQTYNERGLLDASEPPA